MKEKIPAPLLRLAQKIEKPLYVVGGSCRDYIAGLNARTGDWDICAPAGAEEICLAAKEAGLNVSAVYPHTGTVRLTGGEEEYEYTCFRTDKYVRGVHSPESVYFTDDIELDARRRDFKCNAVYYDIKEEKFVDPLGGINDIKKGILSTVAPAEKVFGEDGLRLMRLCRIAAQTGFSPDADCLSGALKNAALIADIAPERVRAELSAILAADDKYGICGGQYRGLRLLHETGVLKIILPELAAGEGVSQRSDFHLYDVLEHSFRCVLYAPPRIRLAALLHDVGKPLCFSRYGAFHGHEEEGARIAAEICARLRFSVKQTERVSSLVKWHMYDFDCKARDNKIRRFIVFHGDIIDDLLLLKQADFSACKDDLSQAPGVVKWKRIRGEMAAEGVPMSLKELDIRGDALIAAGIEPQNVGKALGFLLGECAADARLNRGEKLIKLALGRFGGKKGPPRI